MKTLKIKNNRIFILITILFFSIISILLILMNNYYEKKYIENTKKTISSILITIKNDYPNFTETEIIELINSDNNNFNFKKYGFYENDDLIDSNNKLLNNKNKYLILFLLFTSIIYLIIIFIYFKLINKKYNDILETIKKINNKIYDLDIKNNSDDELSNLKNELYKTTIMLKQNYENEKTEKESIKTSVQDISHQLKTPLTSIAVLLDNILDNENMDIEVAKEFLKDIRNQIDNMNNLIVSLLKTSRFDAGVIQLKREKISINKLLNEINNDLNTILDLFNSSLNINCPKDSYFIGDYSWEKEALTNIIKNSIEYSNNKNIDIKVINNKLFSKIIIKDYGIGIKKEDLKNIFKRFYKSNNSSNSFGIGLNLAKTIIEKDGGYIIVKSEENIGTTFEIKYLKS